MNRDAFCLSNATRIPIPEQLHHLPPNWYRCRVETDFKNDCPVCRRRTHIQEIVLPPWVAQAAFDEEATFRKEKAPLGNRAGPSTSPPLHFRGRLPPTDPRSPKGSHADVGRRRSNVRGPVSSSQVKPNCAGRGSSPPDKFGKLAGFTVGRRRFNVRRLNLFSWSCKRRRMRRQPFGKRRRRSETSRPFYLSSTPPSRQVAPHRPLLPERGGMRTNSKMNRLHRRPSTM